jgi:hypothetical protein
LRDERCVLDCHVRGQDNRPRWTSQNIVPQGFAQARETLAERGPSVV